MNTPAAPTPPLAAPGPTELRRYAVTTAMVALWMSIGWALGLTANGYLLLGIPLLVLFQCFVARRPLFEVWFAQPGRPRMPALAWLVAAAFMIQPVYDLVTWKTPGLDVQLWLIVATLGAVPLSWSLFACTRAQWRLLGLCVLTAGSAGILVLVISFFVRSHSPLAASARILEGLRSFVLYLPVCFMIEEVFFRGCLDSYLTRGGVRAPWLSAFYLSALGGWWHLPTVALQPEHRVAQLAVLVLALPLVHCGVGALLSIFWRRSGLLLVPVCAHAFIDAVRNALL